MAISNIKQFTGKIPEVNDTYEQSMKYVYRNFPCNIRPDSLLWCVSGKDNEGDAGILEWCYDERDANLMIMRMRREPGRFSDLHVHKYE